MSKKIVKRKHSNKNGEVTGQFHVNPLLNNIVYDVELADDTIKEYAASVIAQYIYTAMSDDGKCMQVLQSILDHKTNQGAFPQVNEVYHQQNWKMTNM